MWPGWMAGFPNWALPRPRRTDRATGGAAAEVIEAVEQALREKALGALAVTLDYDCHWQADALVAADALYTDDLAQLEHLKEHGYFQAVGG